MYRMRDVKVPGGTLEFEAETIEQVFEQATLLASMPLYCPIDGSDTALDKAEYDGYVYYSVRSLENPQYSFRYGARKEGKGLFPKGWYEYDAVNKCQWFWKDAKWYAVNKEDGSPLFDKPRPGSGGLKEQAPTNAELDKQPPMATDPGQRLPLVQPEAGKPPAHGPQWMERYEVMNTAGIQLYGAGRWTEDCKRVVSKISGRETEDVNRMTVAQLDRIIIWLHELQAQRVAA